MHSSCNNSHRPLEGIEGQDDSTVAVQEVRSLRHRRPEAGFFLVVVDEDKGMSVYVRRVVTGGGGRVKWGLGKVRFDLMREDWWCGRLD